MNHGSIERAIDEWARALQRAWWWEVLSIAAACIAAACVGLLAYRALIDPSLEWLAGLALAVTCVGVLVLGALRRPRPAREAVAACLDRAVGADGRIATLATVPVSPFGATVEREARGLLERSAGPSLRRATRARFAGALGLAALAALLGLVPPAAESAPADPVAARLAAHAATALAANGDRELAASLERAADRRGVERERTVERVLASVERRAAARAALDAALAARTDGDAARTSIDRGRGDGAVATADALESVARDPRLPPDLAAPLEALARAAREADAAAFARAAADIRRATGGSAATLDAVRSAARALAPSLPTSRRPIPTSSVTRRGPDLGATARPALRAAVRRYFERVEPE